MAGALIEFDRAKWGITTPEANPYFKGLIFSPPGYGKTRLLGSANEDPRTNPILILSYEGGTMSLQKGDPNDTSPDVEIKQVKTWEDYNKMYEMLTTTNHPYKSIGIDSLSETHIMALLARLEEKDHKVANLIEQGDYGIALTQMRQFLRAFRDLPMHVFMTSLFKGDVDPREGYVIKPSLAGALADEAPGIFDVVAYLAHTILPDGSFHRALLLQNQPKYRVKTRTKKGIVAPDFLLDPTVTSLFDALHITQ